MGQGYTRNDTSNNIASGNVIDAADLDGEFDAIVDTFNASTGHTHDGTSSEGAPVTVIGPAQEYVGSGSAFYPKTDSTYTLGDATYAWSNVHTDAITLGGTAITSTAAELNILDGVTATTAELNLMDGVTATTTELNYTDGVTSAIQTQLDAKEASDAGLTSIAGLTTAANKMIYTTASDTYAVADLSSFGRSLIDDASASAARTTLGLVIGTDVQAYASVLAATTASFTTADETKLDAIEASADVTDVTNVTAAGALMDSEVSSLSGIKTLTVPDSTTISSFGATLVDDSNASAARTTLGLAIGTDVQAYDAETLKADTDDNVTGGYTATSDDDGTKSSGTYTPDPAGGNFKHIINGGIFILAAPTASGCYTLVLEVVNNASAGAITFSGFDSESGDTLTTTDGDAFQLVITKSNAKVSVVKQDVT